MVERTLPSVARAGAPLAEAKAAVVLLHGRGGSAEDMLSLADALDRPGLAWIAPRAPGRTWYPLSFLAPLGQNEPALSQALGLVDATVKGLVAEGIAPERIVLAGFSQGGCLALEYAARHARRYGGLVGLSAGLIGPEGTPRDYPGDLAGTPAFLGCSDIDGHIPLKRVEESAEVLQRLDAAVTKRIYPGMGHTINQDEVAAVNALLSRLAPGQ